MSAFNFCKTAFLSIFYPLLTVESDTYFFSFAMMFLLSASTS